jgi:dolichol-phosphate mannosyltransferase
MKETLNKLLIIPTYNEKHNIEQLVREILGLSLGYRLLIIDDNSPDGTGAVVRRLIDERLPMELISRPAKMGLGTAYVLGFKWALEKNFDRVIIMDADLSHQPGYLAQIDGLLNENDLVIGSRYIPGGRIEGWPVGRKLISKFGNIYAKAVSGLTINDMTSGFLGMGKGLVAGIIESGIHTEGYSFLIEIKDLAANNGSKIREFPIVFTDRVAGKSKISRSIIFEALLTCLRMRFFRKTNCNSVK